MDVNPPYLLQSSMQLLCSLPSPTGDASKSGEMDEDAVRRELQSDEVPTFFTEVGDYGRPAGASGRLFEEKPAMFRENVAKSRAPFGFSLAGFLILPQFQLSPTSLSQHLRAGPISGSQDNYIMYLLVA